MAWSKLEDSFREHRKLKRVATALGVRRAEARGLMAGLWSWATTQAPDGDLTDHTPDEIEEAMDWEGDRMAAYDAATDAGLIDVIDESTTLHKWMPRAGSFRKAVQKQKERQSRDSRPPARKVSQARREEKRREERRGEEKKNPLSVSRREPDRSVEIRSVFDHYRTLHPRAHKKPQSKSKEWKAIKARMDEGSTVEDLCRAIDGCHKTPHNVGQNERNQTYLGLELIMRTNDQVTRFAENRERFAEGSEATIKAGMAPKTRKTTEALQRWVKRKEEEFDEKERDPTVRSST